MKKKAEKVLNGLFGLQEVEKLEADSKREHIRLCIKWGEFYAKHQEFWQQDKAEIYAAALEVISFWMNMI